MAPLMAKDPHAQRRAQEANTALDAPVDVRPSAQGAQADQDLRRFARPIAQQGPTQQEEQRFVPRAQPANIVSNPRRRHALLARQASSALSSRLHALMSIQGATAPAPELDLHVPARVLRVSTLRVERQDVT